MIFKPYKNFRRFPLKMPFTVVTNRCISMRLNLWRFVYN